MTDSLHQKQDKTPDTQQQQLHLAIPHTTLHTTYTHTHTIKLGHLNSGCFYKKIFSVTKAFTAQQQIRWSNHGNILFYLNMMKGGQWNYTNSNLTMELILIINNCAFLHLIRYYNTKVNVPSGKIIIVTVKEFPSKLLPPQKKGLNCIN